MEDPISFYKERKRMFEAQLQKNKKSLYLISMLRLLVFVTTIFLVYLFFNQAILASTIAIIGVSLFLFLLKKYVAHKAEQTLNKALKTINEEEIAIGNGTYLDRYDGEVFNEPTHFFSSDIDLFGRGSLFQYLNRTGLKEGTQYLVGLLTANDIDSIKERQEAVKELSGFTEWRQKYTAISRIIESETSCKSISSWLSGYQPFIPSVFTWIVAVFGIISIGIIATSSLKLIGVQFVLYWFLLGLAVTLFFVKRVNDLSAKTSRIKETIQQYALLLDEIEHREFKSSLLQSEKAKIESGKTKASQIFKTFSTALDALDNRNNLIIALLGNGLFLWDLRCSLRIEKWILENRAVVDHWFETVAFFDAYNTLATFAYNHPSFTYPDLASSHTTLIKAKSMGHPLIPKKERVDSDFLLEGSDFLIITGANMAGKSTFLRSVSLFVLMSNVGLPVCAEVSSYRPIKLMTSMRTSDSLTDNSSYFFSELTRLQFIMEHLQKDAYLVILDEILKGTNSVDKAAGSKKLIEKLVGMGVPGIIATHDLSLCKIANSLENVKNYFFETEIENNELYFDYKLKDGVCKNMNASFLLLKMNIT
ncbi:DNA mismatch repair protein MutS [Flagellimonas sp. 389]|uniref:MutS-related protein n=1 Tax=Flagellimonas sp. 389 TaxID=2835862 RepID=UPI001BD2CA5A|nr:DNA mismatch repair protein MutS [Flagellimonas sp. 389]MBS9462165.1 DNA mismatch repair protein MutS [Flagellimonas sp. 389]